MAKTNHQIDMTTGPLLKKIILFTIPLMLTGILQLLYNATDVVIVGKFAGDTSLAAVGSTTSLINLIVNLFMGMSLGTGVIVAQAIGSNRKDRLGAAVHTSILLSLILGVVIGVIGFFLCRPLLTLMSSPEDVIDKASLYMKIYFCGMPGFMVYNFGASILRSAGDTKRPLYILSFSGLVNVALNLVFVIFLHMDVAGVALATIISQYISAISVLFLLTHDEADYKLSIKSLKIKGNILSQILQYGLPIGIQNSLFSFSNVLIQSSINTFGSTILAGNSAAQSIEGFVWQAANSASQAAMTFTGQNFGARKFERVKTVLIECCGFAVSVGLLFGGIVVLFKEPLLSIYTDSPNVITAGSNRIVIICLFYFLCGIMDTVSNVSRGMGKSIVPMIITLICVCAIRIAWLYTIFPIFRSPATVYWSYPITWALAIFFQLIYFIIVYRRFTKTK